MELLLCTRAVCGLARIIEAEGLATVTLPLIREHAVRPPRALWVPFMMGRPFGVPNDADFQKRVMRAALALFNRPAGPVLEDYPEDAPDEMDMTGGWVCPVSFATPEVEDTGAERLRREIQELRTWYDIRVERVGCTTFGAAKLDIEHLGHMLAALSEGDIPDNWRDDVDLGDAVRMAVEDIKVFYQEAVTAQPGYADASSAELADWFFQETETGKMVLEAREICRASDLEILRLKSMVFAPPQYHGKGMDYH